MSKKNKVVKPDHVGFGTLLLWNSRMISTSVTVLLMGYLQMFCTDFLHISPILVSGILVGSKFVDGVTDMFAGFIVDKTQTKLGKARPYELFIIGLTLCTWLMFTVPESWSTAVKCAWIFIMYTLANAVCYTFLNANSQPYTVRAFRPEQFVKLTSYGAIIPMLAAVLFNVAFPQMMAKITTVQGWSRLVLLWLVPLTFIGVLRMITIPEKYDVETKAEQEEKVTFHDFLEIYKRNKNILLVALSTFIMNFITNMGVGIYYYKYIVKNQGLMGIASLASIIILPLMLVVPQILRKMSVMKLIRVGCIVEIIGWFINFIAYDNFPLLMVGGIFTGAGSVPISMLMGLIMIECADYNEYIGIRRMDGSIGSLNGLAGKVGSALGAAALGVFLTIAGYNGDKTATEVVPSAMLMIRMLFSIIPGVLYFLVYLALRFYKLDRMAPEIKAALDKKKAEAAAAESGDAQ